MKNRIIVRLMADVPDESAATRVAQLVRAKIGGLADVESSEAKPYWKIPAWFEILLCLDPPGDPRLAFDGILLVLGKGWDGHGSDDDLWAIWNDKPDTAFFCPNIRWANVECFRVTNNVGQVWTKLSLVRALSFVASSTMPGGWNGEGKGTVVVETLDNTMTFTESGLWTPTGGREIRFWNVFRWTKRDAHLCLEHLRFGVDHPAHLFDLAPADDKRWRSVTPHLCSEDCYKATMVVHSDEIGLEWTVEGPKKDENISYRYTLGS